MRIGGLNKSTGYIGMQEGDIPFARNMVYGKDEHSEGISNESGTALVSTLGKEIIGMISTNDNRDIIFSGRVGTGAVS